MSQLFSLRPRAERVLLQFNTHPDCALAPIQTQFSLEKYRHTHTRLCIIIELLSAFYPSGKKEKKKKKSLRRNYTQQLAQEDVCFGDRPQLSAAFKVLSAGHWFPMAKKNSPNRYTILAHWIQQPAAVALLCYTHGEMCIIVTTSTMRTRLANKREMPKWRIAFSCPAQLLKCSHRRDKHANWWYSGPFPFFFFSLLPGEIVLRCRRRKIPPKANYTHSLNAAISFSSLMDLVLYTHREEPGRKFDWRSILYRNNSNNMAIHNVVNVIPRVIPTPFFSFDNARRYRILVFLFLSYSLAVTQYIGSYRKRYHHP